MKALCLPKKQVMDAGLIAQVPDELKARIVNHIVSNREPVVENFIGPLTERSWLHSMGYLYHKQGKIFNFICTSENGHKITCD